MERVLDADPETVFDAFTDPTRRRSCTPTRPTGS
jgi:uncharacterized protein YndB with AHSA1/START domain